ncbi:MAG: hypothetical protein RLZZ352_2878 [Pseudomonadota bacterium]
MLLKTEKGREELRPGQRSLDQRERAVLLLANGQQPEAAIAALFDGEGQLLIDRLLQQGYLQRPTKPDQDTEAVAHTSVDAVAAESVIAAPGTHGEAFVGAPSLASARMYLFDLSERLFAPRDKALAERYRESLRQARDAPAMLAVGLRLIEDVHTLAGAERADRIRQRLVKLLPQEVSPTGVPAVPARDSLFNQRAHKPSPVEQNHRLQ